jgi:hypothetical protein
VSARRSSALNKKGSPSGEPFVHPRSNRSVPSGLAEELALERHAALEHAARAAALWRARCYADSLAESAAADAACARVRELEAVR